MQPYSDGAIASAFEKSALSIDSDGRAAFCCQQVLCPYPPGLHPPDHQAPSRSEQPPPQSIEQLLDKDSEAGIQILVQLLRTHDDRKAAVSAALGAVLALQHSKEVCALFSCLCCQHPPLQDAISDTCCACMRRLWCHAPASGAKTCPWPASATTGSRAAPGRSARCLRICPRCAAMLLRITTASATTGRTRQQVRASHSFHL